MRTQSFIRYCSEDRIIAILIKERVKWIGKTDESRDYSPVYKELCRILPARRTWVTPCKKQRSSLRNERTNQLKNAATALKLTIARDRSGICRRKEGNKDLSRPDYIPELIRFIADIIETVSHGSVPLSTPKTTGIFKKKEDLEDKVLITFRPISVYEDLKTKVLIKLASEYLTGLLDPLFHEEILSYRQRRNYHGEHPKEKYMTKADDAIPNIQRFRQEHDSAWVAECDIKKFYDIVNHDQVMAALDRLMDEGKIDREKASGAVAILKSYMDGYNFKESVLDKSREPGYWDPYIKGLARSLKLGGKKVECQFGWLSEHEFFERGGYSPETWESDYRKIGIPQGGVLSTLICNILMNDVDRAVVDTTDKSRLFNRFGDDIILMHETEAGCRRLFEAYKESLTAHQLIYHNEKSVGDNYKVGGLTQAGYWDEKTKAPFRWGRGEGNAAEWIGFVGYEISCDGYIRLRKSTLKKQFNKICHRYHLVTRIDEVKTDVSNCMKTFDRIAWSIMKFDQLDFNPASRKQMHHLDRYRHNKRNKAERYLSGLPKTAKEERMERPNRPASYASVLSMKK